MKALLMHPDRDFDPEGPLPRQEPDLTLDMALDTLWRSMAGEDQFLFDIARTALLSGQQNDVDTILYRQDILKDCLQNAGVIRELYELAIEAHEGNRKHYFGYLLRHPSSVLNRSVDLLQMLIDILGRLRKAADLHAERFESRGFTTLFAMLQREFDDEYLARVRNQLTELKFKAGVLLSAELGSANAGTNYVLRQPSDKRPNWLERILGKGSPAYTFRIDPRDEAGARALSELRDRGVNLVANAAAQATDHILSFFDMLQTELAFYVGCLNLRDRLDAIGAPLCLPDPKAVSTRELRFEGLYDVCLALTMGRSVVDNCIGASGKKLVIVTGANQGGKSTFLRSVGLAQLMMQSGMFVGATSFTAELCTGLFTHFKREEDATMRQGKLDEEMSRMSAIADDIVPDSMLLFNESFAATNDREGSEIATQVVSALLEKRVRIVFVTHLYEFAHGFFTEARGDALFLRAERRPDGTRTFRLLEGEPLETSYGEDVYAAVFAAGP